MRHDRTISWKTWLIPLLLLGVSVASGCNNDDIQDLANEVGGVPVSGTIVHLTIPSSGGGIHLMGAFPAGVPAGPTGNVGGGSAPLGDVVSFTINVKPNSGNVYIYAFQDKNLSGDPTNPGTDEPYGCTNPFFVGTAPVGGIVANIDYAPDPTCP